MKLGIHNIRTDVLNSGLEPQKTLLYELELFQPVFTNQNIELSAGVNGTLRNDTEIRFLPASVCDDCPEYTFSGNSLGIRAKLTALQTKTRLSFFTGINRNNHTIEQISYGYGPPVEEATLPPLQYIESTYINLDSGIRFYFPLYKSLSFTGDARFYLPLDNSEFNKQRTTFSAGLSFGASY